MQLLGNARRCVASFDGVRAGAVQQELGVQLGRGAQRRKQLLAGGRRHGQVIGVPRRRGRADELRIQLPKRPRRQFALLVEHGQRIRALDRDPNRLLGRLRIQGEAEPLRVLGHEDRRDQLRVELLRFPVHAARALDELPKVAFAAGRGDGPFEPVLSHVVGRSGQRPTVLEALVQLPEVQGRRPGRGLPVVPFVDVGVNAQMVIPRRRAHELPHPLGPGPRHGLRGELALQHGQPGQVHGKTRAGQFRTDMGHVLETAVEAGLEVGLVVVLDLFDLVQNRRRQRELDRKIAHNHLVRAALLPSLPALKQVGLLFAIVEDALKLAAQIVEHGRVEVRLRHQFEHVGVVAERRLRIVLLLGLIRQLEGLLGLTQHVSHRTGADRCEFLCADLRHGHRLELVNGLALRGYTARQEQEGSGRRPVPQEDPVHMH